MLFCQGTFLVSSYGHRFFSRSKTHQDFRSTYLKRKRICITHQIILMKANDLETVAIDAANFLSTTSDDQSDSMS